MSDTIIYCLIPGIYKNFSELYSRQGNFKKALYFSNLNNKINDSLGSASSVEKIRKFESMLESEKKDKKINRLMAEKIRDDLQLMQVKNKILFLILCSFLGKIPK